ncbi:MAG: dihydrolipoyl dehydrogenase [Rhodospirillales bacterium]|nr:dihydrolipoyl dehydrogenase [Rhodospirillales bacterium]|tara:strand:+ start:2977 stop:4374 length:1398 start_codon:yes stop_codon:yes gene_type:complete
MANTSFDIIVIGGGPGGYVAAIRSSQLGMKTALVERDHLGGVCLNWGCIPTKALLRTSEIYHALKNANELGITTENISFDLNKIVSRSRDVAKKLNHGIEHLLNKNNVHVIPGEGGIIEPGVVCVKDQNGENNNLNCKNIILATGARPRSLPGIETDGKRIWNYRDAMVPNSMPNSLLVVGSGAIGMEFASFYGDLGASVTIIEVMDRILPAEDREISLLARNSFENQGMLIHTGATLKSLESNQREVKAEIEIEGNIKTQTFDNVILAVGIVGNTEILGLEKTAVEVEGSHLVVNKWQETAELGIFAIGDLVGPPWLAHKASHEASICVEYIAGLESKPLDISKIPGCTYCRPQIASVGLSEEKAIGLGYNVKIGRFPLVANGKAIALGTDEGLIKTVFDAQTGELLGAHMIGAEVTEMIQGYVIARSSELTEEDLIHTVFPHPTISESMHESVLEAFERAIHI